MLSRVVSQRDETEARLYLGLNEKHRGSSMLRVDGWLVLTNLCESFIAASWSNVLLIRVIYYLTALREMATLAISRQSNDKTFQHPNEFRKADELRVLISMSFWGN